MPIQFVLFILLCGLSACQSGAPAKTDEGIISYQILYPEAIQAKSFSSFLPTRMVSTFKGKNYKISIKSNLSLYNLEYISKANGDSSATLFRIFDKNLFTEHKDNEHLFLFENSKPTRVEFIKDETKEIAGIRCKKAMVHFNDADQPSTTVYYTDSIQFKRPAENSPFDDIPGALMEFNLHFKELELHFIADHVKLQTVSAASFSIPRHFEATRHGEIGELVSALIE